MSETKIAKISLTIPQEYHDAKAAERTAKRSILSGQTRMVEDALARFGIKIGDTFVFSDGMYKLTLAAWSEKTWETFTVDCSLTNGTQWRLMNLAELIELKSQQEQHEG